jgi:hypothetical protein
VIDEEEHLMRVKFLMVLLLLLFLEGCSQASAITITDENHQEIENYLLHEVMNPTFGGENFTAYEVLGSDQEKGEIYIWAFIQEYYRKGSGIEEGTGMSVPMVVKLDQSGNSFKVGSHTLPRDGSLYADDLKDLFPKLAERKALDYPSRYITKLVEEAEDKANKKLN